MQGRYPQWRHHHHLLRDARLHCARGDLIRAATHPLFDLRQFNGELLMNQCLKWIFNVIFYPINMPTDPSRAGLWPISGLVGFGSTDVWNDGGTATFWGWQWRRPFWVHPTWWRPLPRLAQQGGRVHSQSGQSSDIICAALSLIRSNRGLKVFVWDEVQQSQHGMIYHNNFLWSCLCWVSLNSAYYCKFEGLQSDILKMLTCLPFWNLEFFQLSSRAFIGHGHLMLASHRM